MIQYFKFMFWNNDNYHKTIKIPAVNVSQALDFADEIARELDNEHNIYCDYKIIK